MKISNARAKKKEPDAEDVYSISDLPMSDSCKTTLSTLFNHMNFMVQADDRKHLRKIYKRILEQPIVVTNEGKIVIHGDVVFRQQDELGIPIVLQLSSDSFNKDYFQVNWAEYLEACHKSGRKKKTVLLELGHAINDAWGFEYKNNIIPTCEWYASKLWKD